MLTIGLTGGIGSGKSAAGQKFSELGAKVVDADQASRAVVEADSPALQAIAVHFGSELIEADGTLARRKLRDIIFSDEAEKHWLEQLLHPLIRAWITDQLASAQSPYAVLESPLLLETNQYQMIGKVVVVDVPVETQVERYISRDGGTEQQARAVIASQMSRKERLAKADYVIDNTGTMDELHQQLEKLHRIFLNQPF